MKKFDYYLKLRELGIKEEAAVSMTTQSNKSSREGFQAEGCDSASAAILGFAEWAHTTEGESYWSFSTKMRVDIKPCAP